MFSKLRFSQKENLKKCTSFEEQEGTRYIRRNVYFGIVVFNCLSFTKPFHSYLGNEVDLRDIMNVSPNIVAEN